MCVCVCSCVVNTCECGSQRLASGVGPQELLALFGNTGSLLLEPGPCHYGGLIGHQSPGTPSPVSAFPVAGLQYVPSGLAFYVCAGD